MRALIVIAVAVVVLAAACARKPDPVAIPDDRIGLVDADVFDVPAPDAVEHELAEPGEGAVIALPSSDLPPVVPHAIADFLPITADANACVDCHAVQEKIAGEPTPIPPSHYTDLRSAPDRVAPEIVGARWSCLACHVARTGAQPLVANTYAR